MKQLIKSLVLVAIFVGTTLPAWSQASTEGKEFWVGLTWAVTPPDKNHKSESDTYYKVANPYIAISAKKKGTSVTLTNPADPNWSMTYTTKEDNEWHEFKDIPYKYWYPEDMRTIANFAAYADKKKDWGIQVHASNNISVYSVVRADYSMDASNILPVTALKTEYYMQDFWPEFNNDADFTGPATTMATILATENSTTIDIYLKGNTYGKTNAGTKMTISLDKGQIYYLLGANKALMSGTRIVSHDGKPIAVFLGDPITRLPAGVGARDCLYEQAMPTDYWGTDFIVARSTGKDANYIGITALKDFTEVYLDGMQTPAGIIEHQGETFWIELYNKNGDPTSKKDTIQKNHPIRVGQDALYIQTSCPCAVYNYDTGNSYKGSPSDNENGHGDPSMVWVSPIQQKINHITFGTCTTNKTKEHFLNVVTGTAERDSTKLVGYYEDATTHQLYPVSLMKNVVWNTVPGNAAYSYARIQLVYGKVTLKDSYTLSNSKGFIATVYGNGEDESYAYSAGSAAVELGVEIDGELFVSGSISDTRFCVGSELHFDANVGGKNEVTQVNWDFGDGITESNAEPQVSHQYTVPGWYDVKADLFGHQVCTTEESMPLGSIKFSFRVVRPDTIRHQSYDCKEENYSGSLDSVAIVTYDCDSVVITEYLLGLNSSYEYNDTVFDRGYVHDRWYERDTTVTWTIPNAAQCDSIITCYLRVIACLHMDIPNKPEDQHVCPGESYDLKYNYQKGDIGETHLLYGDTDIIVKPSGGYITLPISKLEPGIYHAKITVQDTLCDKVLTFPIDFSVFYPKDIIKYKYNNVLAVYNTEHNGGYEFVAPYQWYRNGELIPGATSSVYHSEEPFVLGDSYYVVLTDKNGMTLPSCPLPIEIVPDFTPTEQQQAPASKHLVNRQIVIQKGDQSYNVFGQRIQ